MLVSCLCFPAHQFSSIYFSFLSCSPVLLHIYSKTQLPVEYDDKVTICHIESSLFSSTAPRTSCPVHIQTATLSTPSWGTGFLRGFQFEINGRTALEVGLYAKKLNLPGPHPASVWRPQSGGLGVGRPWLCLSLPWGSCQPSAISFTHWPGNSDVCLCPWCGRL